MSKLKKVLVGLLEFLTGIGFYGFGLLGVAALSFFIGFGPAGWAFVGAFIHRNYSQIHTIIKEWVDKD